MTWFANKKIAKYITIKKPKGLNSHMSEWFIWPRTLAPGFMKFTILVDPSLVITRHYYILTNSLSEEDIQRNNAF